MLSAQCSLVSLYPSHTETIMNYSDNNFHLRESPTEMPIAHSLLSPPPRFSRLPSTVASQVPSNPSLSTPSQLPRPPSPEPSRKASSPIDSPSPRSLSSSSSILLLGPRSIELQKIEYQTGKGKGPSKAPNQVTLLVCLFTL